MKNLYCIEIVLHEEYGDTEKIFQTIFTDSYVTEKLNITKIPRYKKKFTQNGFFNVKFDDIQVHLANNGIGMKILFIKGFKKDDIFAFHLMDYFVNTDSFIQARYYNHEYDYWQNVKSLQIYGMHNKDYSHLKLISNGFPPPMEELVVDISENNGRRILHQNYVEYVGEIMWFSKELLSFLNSHVEELKNSAYCQTKYLDRSDILRIKVNESNHEVYDSYFYDIRKLIYPK